jgi:hypothetical protein
VKTFSVKISYALSPGPVARHKITVLSFVVLEVAVGYVVDPIGQIGVCEEVVDDFSRVTVPELVLSVHPLGRGRVVWTETVVPGGIRLPGHVSKFDRIDCRVKVVVAKYWCRVLVGD